MAIPNKKAEILAPPSSLDPDDERLIIPIYLNGKDPRPFIWVKASRINGKGFVKKKWLVDTGATRSTLCEKDAQILKLKSRGSIKVKSAMGSTRRNVVNIAVQTLLSGKPSDNGKITSSTILAPTIRKSTIGHSILGIDWICKIQPRFEYY